MRAKARSEAFALKQLAHQEARDAAAAAAEEWGGLGTAAGTAAGKEAAKKVKQAYQPPEKLLTQYYGKINVEKYDGPKLPAGGAASKIGTMQKKVDASRRRNTDKADRATTEQVLDPRAYKPRRKNLKGEGTRWRDVGVRLFPTKAFAIWWSSPAEESGAPYCHHAC